ncbi:sialidase family protein [Haladaptatus salinisoli]|uniref:sialidase family protein n=1 Tax=Haladaptatus salinisoli TaxID=2884876 RepID=UPI001D0B3E22|nr:YCF48-related protein [Haladaptatus salinisoli]
MERSARSPRGFVAFYRRYTKTWLHALATAALTAFGMLTFLHDGFAVVALAVYVVPPVALYLSGGNFGGVDADGTDAAGVDSATESASDSEDAPIDPDEPAAGTASWTTADVPTDATLFDAGVTDAGAHAVGEGGVVLARATEREWRVALPDGPGAEANDLRGVDATTDGSAVWFAGDGGALGRLNPETGRHADHSAPSGVTDNWADVAVAGSDGDETILLVNGSGQVLRGRRRDGDVAWDAPVKPGSGSSLCAAALVDTSVGYLCDTNDCVFETTDGGESFRRVGVESADGTFTDVAATARGDCAATADDGVLHRYDDGNWTPVRLGDEALRALALDDGRAVACADSGVVYERAGATADWERVPTPATGALRGVALGARRAVAVGEGGTVVAREE